MVECLVRGNGELCMCCAQRRLQGGGRVGGRPPLEPQKGRFVPLFPVQENNITNIISFILIRFRLKELKRNKKGQNIARGRGGEICSGGAKNFSRPSGAKIFS